VLRGRTRPLAGGEQRLLAGAWVTDAFTLFRRGSQRKVVRASRELGADRMNTQVGPFGIDVLEGLKRLRVVLSPNEFGLSFDVTWEGSIPAQVEPRPGHHCGVSGADRPLCPAISPNARFSGYSAHNVTVTACVANVHETDG
jgi:hypothetical protein